jgi:hypothetical protein
MNNIKERPICHRAEDLVSYLYGEASAAEAHDFAEHMERCASCQSEFQSFQHVHESIAFWRNETLGGTAVVTAPVSTVEPAILPLADRPHSARTALREFFSASPLWLRGATAFAGLLLCVLAALAVSRLWLRTPVPQNTATNADKVYSETDFRNAVKAEVDKQVNALKNSQAGNAPPKLSVAPLRSSTTAKGPQIARAPRVRLTPQEREQLAADLRLIPGREDQLPFVFSDEPEQ